MTRRAFIEGKVKVAQDAIRAREVTEEEVNGRYNGNRLVQNRNDLRGALPLVNNVVLVSKPKLRGRFEAACNLTFASEVGSVVRCDN
jgi:hypothetical protein